VSEIRWEDPPKPGQQSNNALPYRPAFADELIRHPKRWAVIATYEPAKRKNAYAYAYLIRNGKMAWAAPAGTFETICRAVDGEQRVYARYVGDGAS
jgi:hypothetical protein